MPNKKRAYALITVPDRKGIGTPYEEDSRRDFMSKQGDELSSLTLPDGTVVIDSNGNEQDVSRFTFVSASRFVKHDEDNGVYSVSFPLTHADGTPWTFVLSRIFGKHVQGAFVVEGKREIEVTASELSEALHRDE